MELLGLKDDYSHDGRVLLEALDPSVLPPVIRDNLSYYESLAAAYKQIMAPVGQLGLATLQISTVALESGSSSNDSTYTTLESALASLTASRNAVAAQIIAALESAEFGGGNAFNAGHIQSLINQANSVLSRAKSLQASAKK